MTLITVLFKDGKIKRFGYCDTTYAYERATEMSGREDVYLVELQEYNND